jgi:hypothetical protein
MSGSGHAPYPVGFNALVRLALVRLPFLRERFEQEFDYFGDEEPAPHLLFEDVVVLYVAEHASDPGHRDELAGIFALAEELAAHPDPLVSSIADVSFAEAIAGNYADLAAAVLPDMGERTRRFTLAAAARMGVRIV